jgi:hypothetical protein
VEGGLWQSAFIWMLLEASKAGLKIDTQKVREVLHKTPIHRPAWTNQKHESLKGWWCLAEFFPKIPKWRGPGFHWPSFGLFRCRTIPEGALLHRTALRRIRRTSLQYRPTNLSPQFQETVKKLPQTPRFMPYKS